MLSFESARNFVRDQINNIRTQFDVRVQIDKVKKDFHEAAPAIRDLLPSGFAVIGKSGTDEQIGVLVFELYELELAKVVGIPTDADKIAAFENSLIRLHYPDSSTPENRKERVRIEALIRGKIEDEYQPRYDRGEPLPCAISKLQAEYYIGELGKAGLEVIEVNGIKANIDTGKFSDQAKRQEKIAHYLAQWASWSITLSIAFATAMTVSLWLAPFVFAITYFAKKSGNDFGMYDVAEALLRDGGWALNKKLGWEGKLDRTKALKTLGYGIAIVATALLAANAAWVGTLLLPGWGLLSLALPSAIMNALQVGIAGYFAAIAGIATLAGSIATTRFFCTLSPWNTQIPFTADQQDAFEAVSVTERQDVIEDKIHRLLEQRNFAQEEEVDVIRDQVDTFITQAFNLPRRPQPQQTCAAAAANETEGLRRRSTRLSPSSSVK